MLFGVRIVGAGAMVGGDKLVAAVRRAVGREPLERFAKAIKRPAVARRR
jgi:hypothetical protein